MNFKQVKVGVVQATPFLLDKAKTVERVIEWIEKAAKAQCELLLFPESFIPCYPVSYTHLDVYKRQIVSKTISASNLCFIW